MNLVVNKTGVLQYMTPQQNQEQSQTAAIQGQTTMQGQTAGQLQEPLDHAVKHSFIYNKYFKDYQDVVKEVPQVKIPKTKEEYLQMLIEERINQIEERKRLSIIKSKKMMFTNNTNNTNQTGKTENIHASVNSLHVMKFY
jgi:hypothetical protein